ncbi:uncharacterized protein LOC128642503 [Bombina bombina]|uniref:uncharacterized protein LOC128642503 n=1 Tax=Bombina bombina TaxID=8345 RepID=UPI00235A6409|nr:uncharacterized protein LOC128642503 [Bombina bombina]
MEDLNKLRNEILDFQIKELSGVTRVLLQVFGSAGHGKSSFVNSISYALIGGNFKTTAPVASGSEAFGGLTTIRHSYKLTDLITAVDNRGFGKMDSYETQEIYAQLANILPLDEPVQWSDTSFADTLKKVYGAQLLSEDLIVPIYVYSVEETLNKERAGEISSLLKIAQQMSGILPIVVLTKKNKGDAHKVQKMFVEIGMENIYPVENYTPDDNVKTPGKDRQFLVILSEALQLAEFRMKTVADLHQDHEERMQQLLLMACEREKEKALEEQQRVFEKEKNELNEKIEKANKKWCILS